MGVRNNLYSGIINAVSNAFGGTIVHDTEISVSKHSKGEFTLRVLIGNAVVENEASNNVVNAQEVRIRLISRDSLFNHADRIETIEAALDDFMNSFRGQEKRMYRLVLTDIDVTSFEDEIIYDWDMVYLLKFEYKRGSAHNED